MRYISCKLEDLRKIVLPIGYEGENEHTRVQVDAGEVFKEYPAAVPTLKVHGPGGSVYPATVTRDGNSVIWDIKASDCAADGNGEAQFTFTNNNVIVKSCIAKIKVHRSITGGTTPPDPVQDWIDAADEVLDDLEAMDNIAKNAEAGDVGKALSPKTVEDGVVTEWQYIEPGGGTEDYTDLDNKPQIGGVTLTGDLSLHDLGIAAESAIPDVSGKANLTVVAPEFVQGTANAAGSFVTYTDGVVYLLPDGHTAGTTWANTTKTATNIGEQLGTLKNAIQGVNKGKLLNNFGIGSSAVGRDISPIVSFVDDDNNYTFRDFWLPIASSKHVPVAVSVIVGKVGTTGFGTWDDLKEYRDDYGVEILSHSYYHKIASTDYDSLTVDEIAEDDFGLARRVLAEHGFYTDVMVFPGASSDNIKVRQAALRDYNGCIADGDGINVVPIDHYNIRWKKYAFNDGVIPNIATLKGYVDQCVASNGWLVLNSHSQYNSMTSETQQIICDLIDYIRQVGAEVVTVHEGFKRLANIVEVDTGEHHESELKIDPYGKVKSQRGIGVGVSTRQVHNFYSKVSSFEKDNITEERIVTNTNLFPHSDMGILRTIRIDQAMVQTFIPYNYQEIWTRICQNDELPGFFSCAGNVAGAYDNRLLFASEKVGNMYYDTTNGRMIICKTAGKRTVDKFEVTSGATNAGNITISTAFGSKTVALEAGDTTESIANKIASTAFVGFNVIQCAENPMILYITRILCGSVGHSSFADTDSTGTMITVTQIASGSAPVWTDMSGNTL